jgi:hypothetical protein
MENRKFKIGDKVEIIGNKDNQHCYEVGEIGRVVLLGYEVANDFYYEIKIDSLIQTIFQSDLKLIE